MTLKEFKQLCGMTCAHLAKRCGVTATYMRNIACGHAYPSQRLAKLIEYHTAGAVPATTWPLRVRKRKGRR